MTYDEIATQMRAAAELLIEVIGPIQQDHELWWLTTEPFKQTIKDLKYEAGRLEDFANRKPGDRE